MNTSYKTVRTKSDAELIEKKSRFIAHIAPVTSEAEALAFLEEIRTENRSATHNVYAYILRENNIMRYSDDGEPSGTSGVPTLEVLRKEGLTDCIAVITRYFGGTLLGAGGLVRAYSKAAKMGVDAAGIVTRALCREISVTVDYGMSGKIQYSISESGLTLRDSEYGDKVTFRVIVPTEECDKFLADMTEVSFGQAVLSVGEEEYMEL